MSTEIYYTSSKGGLHDAKIDIKSFLKPVVWATCLLEYKVYDFTINQRPCIFCVLLVLVSLTFIVTGFCSFCFDLYILMNVLYCPGVFFLVCHIYDNKCYNNGIICITSIVFILLMHKLLNE